MPRNKVTLLPVRAQTRRLNDEARMYIRKSLLPTANRALGAVERLGQNPAHADAMSSYHRAHAAALNFRAAVLDLIAALDYASQRYAAEEEDR